MVPADADDIKAQYEILLDELRKFNPQLEDKQRVLAVTKSDMLDEELKAEIRPTLPTDLPTVFISAVSGEGLMELKDALWKAITDDANRIEEMPITHRPLDGHHRVREEDEFIFENVPALDEDEEFDEEGTFIDEGDYFGPDDDEDDDNIDYEWKYGDTEL
jgi:GTP-binding protein